MIWQERILAFVQIFFESIPLSSSAHVLVAKSFISRLSGEAIKISGQHFFLWHIPSLFIFCVFVFSILFNECLAKSVDQRPLFVWQTFRTMILLCLSCIPTIALYMAKVGKFGPIALWKLLPGFAISAFVLLAIKFTRPTKPEWPIFTISDSVLFGFFQAIALVPGVSRMAVTTASGFFLGYHGLYAFIFSLCQQIILTIGMLVKMVVFDQMSLSELVLMPWDIVVLFGATVFGIANLYFTFKVFCAYRTELFAFYYLVLAIATLVLSF